MVDLEQRSERPPAAWVEPASARRPATAEVSALLTGASRVLMAAKLADAPHHAQVQALIVQAIELATQISRSLAAQRDATSAQRRAAEATRAAAVAAAAVPRAAGWSFTKTGSEVIESARSAHVAGQEPQHDTRRAVGSEPRVDPNVPDR